MATDKAVRSLLADHILGQRNTIRRMRTTIATAKAQDATYTVTWYDGALHEAEVALQLMRYLSAEMRGR
jgi:hypothetical protein